MGEDISIQAFFDYLRGVKSKSTARKYAGYAASFLRLMRANGYHDFKEIPPGFLSEFASMLSRDQKSASTVRVQVYAAKKYLDWVRSKGIPVEVQSKPDLPKRPTVMRPVLPASQFTAFFRQADLDLEEPMRTAVMLLPCCGLRASEVVQLKLGDIHKARVKLQSKDKRGEPKYKTTLFLKVRGKGNKERHVPLMEEGVEILTGYLAGWRRRQSGPWLFPRTTAKRGVNGRRHISDRYLRAALQRMREPLGLSEITPHTMRRTYITTLWRKRIDLKTISAIAGHSNVQTTIDHYIAMEPADAVNALHAAGGSLTED